MQIFFEKLPASMA